MTEHDQTVAVAVGEVLPIEVVLYDDQSDGGFSVLFADAPEYWHGTPEQTDQLRTICVHCLIEHNSDIGRGLDLARRHGSAERYPDPQTGDWRGRDPESGDWL